MNIKSTIDYQAIAKELAGIETTTNSDRLAKLSLDYYHFSPILTEQLQDKRGELAVFPQNGSRGTPDCPYLR